jgi:hypothetical protein
MVQLKCPKCTKPINVPGPGKWKCSACSVVFNYGPPKVKPPAPVEPKRAPAPVAQPRPNFPMVCACPYCRAAVSAGAVKCPHCQEWLDEDYRPVNFDPGVAAVLSLIIPGAGQMYRGNIALGVLWLVIVPIGYVPFILPGFVLHIICIATATTRPRR